MIGTHRRAVLNTRPSGQAGQLTRLLERAGFEVLEAPAIQVVPAWEPVDLDRVRRDLRAGTFDWVVLASQNAGLALADVIGRTPVVCGSQTARALGLQPDRNLDRFSASAALDVLRPLVMPAQHVLAPRGADGSAELTTGLLALGAIVEAPIAYRTVAVEPSTLQDAAQRLRDRRVQAVTVCSPSAVSSLVAALGRESLALAALICLGHTTAEAAHQAGLRVDGVAERTTMHALVDAVAGTLGAAA